VIIDRRNPEEQATAREELPEPFAIETRPDRGRVHLVPRGVLDLATVGEVTRELDDLVARGFGEIVLDLRRVCFMDSTGLRMIIRQSARDDLRLTVIDGPSAVSRLFDVTGMRSAVRFEAIR
jgi:anti-sigma B factor antagonist